MYVPVFFVNKPGRLERETHQGTRELGLANLLVRSNLHASAVLERCLVAVDGLNRQGEQGAGEAGSCEEEGGRWDPRTATIIMMIATEARSQIIMNDPVAASSALGARSSCNEATHGPTRSEATGSTTTSPEKLPPVVHHSVINS